MRCLKLTLNHQSKEAKFVFLKIIWLLCTNSKQDKLRETLPGVVSCG